MQQDEVVGSVIHKESEARQEEMEDDEKEQGEEGKMVNFFLLEEGKMVKMI